MKVFIKSVLFSSKQNDTDLTCHFQGQQAFHHIIHTARDGKLAYKPETILFNNNN